MTKLELLVEARLAKARGHNYIQLKLFRRRSPKNWDRVRILPGIYGRCIGELDDRVGFLVDVPLDPILEVLGNPAERRPTQATEKP